MLNKMQKILAWIMGEVTILMPQ